MKKFYVTTPIYTVNAPPHVGHAYADIIADVLARYHRIQKEEVFFLAGVGENGAKVVRAAENKGQSVEEFVTQTRGQFRSLLRLVDASNDEFIYTTDQTHHWPGAQKLWKKFIESGDVYRASYKGLYCVGHEAFVTEKDLIDGICPDHQQKPEVVEEENYFFRLSKYASRIERAITSGEFQIFPEKRKNEVLSFLKEKIEDISFSRPSKDISWSIPVPGDGTQTIYVWADELANYISALGYGRTDESRFKMFWPADVHIVGKDILRFHAIYWPAMLMSAGLPLPRALYVHGMIISGGVKMSKTIGNVIDPVEIITEYGADAFRYFLMREIPFGEDGDFTRERFANVYEGSLAHGLGNLVARIATMIRKNFPDGIDYPGKEVLADIPAKNVLSGKESASLDDIFESAVRVPFKVAMNSTRLTEAITLLFRFYPVLDGYIQDYEPYRLVKTDSQKAAAILWNLAHHILESAPLLEPFMPQTSEHIGRIFVRDGERMIAREHDTLFPSKKVYGV